MKSRFITLAVLLAFIPATILAQAPDFEASVLLPESPPDVGTPSTSISLDAPATIEVGFLMVAEIATKGNTDITGPAGWSRIGATFDIPVISDDGVDGEPGSVAFFTKMAELEDENNAGVGSYYTFSWTGGGDGVESAGLILVYSGVDQFKPVENLFTEVTDEPSPSNGVWSADITSSVARNESMVVEMYAAQENIETNSYIYEPQIIPMSSSGLSKIEAKFGDDTAPFPTETSSSLTPESSVSIGAAGFAENVKEDMTKYVWETLDDGELTQWVLGALIINPPARATYTVQKTFNPDEQKSPVTVYLNCSGGDPDFSYYASAIIPEVNDLTPPYTAVFEIVGFNADNPPVCEVTEEAWGFTGAPEIEDCTYQLEIDGDYTCNLTNTFNEATFNVTKVWADGRQEEVDVQLICNDYQFDGPTTTIDQQATLTASGFDVYTSINPTSDTWCSVSEVVPDFQMPVYSDECLNVWVKNGGEYDCTITNVEARATFAVNKLFMDGNDQTPVTLNIKCNTGTPLSQSITVLPDEQVENGGYEVNFVVTNFTGGAMDCTVWEEEVPDYSASYDCSLTNNASDNCTDGESSPLDQYGSGPCNYENVNMTNGETGEHFCTIRNYPDAVPVSVSKEWIVPQVGGNEIPMVTDITIWCDSPIVGGSQDSGYYFETFNNVSGNQTVTSYVIPDSPSSDCWASETIDNSAIENESDCGDADSPGMTVSAANGDHCTMTNTVFFEGIPTLSQYGLAILALLTLSVGLVGFRRQV
jgi:hypothetical protein